MKTPNSATLLFQSYLKNQHSNADPPNELSVFLSSRLSAEDYLEAEELFNEALANTEEAAFYAGCQYLPRLLKNLIED